MASSVWGNSTISGKPSQVDKIEFMIYAKEKNNLCENFGGPLYPHCIFGYSSDTDSKVFTFMQNLDIKFSFNHASFLPAKFKYLKLSNQTVDKR